MKLNCDLGESYGAWNMAVDEHIMVYIDQANVACGFHAGDPIAIGEAIALAKKHNVSVGAHPSYPDLQGFGRRSMAMKPDELIACLHYQISALRGMTAIQGVTLDYVKPHGALYNDMMADASLRRHVMQAVAEAGEGNLSLMMQAHPSFLHHQDEAAEYTLDLIFEAFADRRYADNGLLVPRTRPDAVLSEQEALEQAQRIMDEGVIITESGQTLTLKVDTLCVHGDSPGAIAMAEQLRLALTKRKLSS
ncbi:5-oxoprolinase subunit PxpA [Alteromonas sp. CYL-A6]|uniref:5-oxoprolinase subunit PxpA n=1 Tax=Alteromonas nitratireducens TaxID=3390813 RepID=UPI0034B6E27F